MNARTMFMRNIDVDKLTNETITNTAVVAHYRIIKLGILLSFQVLSVICSLFILICIIYRPAKFLKPVGNHFIFILLITSFIQVTSELSMVENYLLTGVVRPSTNSYCLFFNWYEFSLNGISLFVMLWASIERHIIVFSVTIVRIQWKCIITHYLPLSIAVLYTPLCYAFLIFVYKCTNNWDYNQLLCTAPCYYQNQLIGAIDWLVNIITPAFSILLANILLIVRVIYRSTGVRYSAERKRNNRKMTIQLLTISSLFLVFWLPIAVTGLIQQFFLPTFLMDIQFNVFFYLIYFIQLFMPFVCLVSLSEMKNFINVEFRRWNRRNRAVNTMALQMVSIIPTAHY